MSMMNANAAATTTMTANEPLDFELPEIGEAEFSNEELAEDFIDFMTSSPDDAVRGFLERFMAEVRASTDGMSGLEPLYAVSHTCQLTDDDRMYWPHIHILWGIKKK